MKGDIAGAGTQGGEVEWDGSGTAKVNGGYQRGAGTPVHGGGRKN